MHALNATPDSPSTQVQLSKAAPGHIQPCNNNALAWKHPPISVLSHCRSCPLMESTCSVHALQAKIMEVAACLSAVADSLAASGRAAQQPANPIISTLQGQGALAMLTCASKNRCAYSVQC